MNKIYIGLMDNGSGEAVIHTISNDPITVLKHLQKTFLKWRDAAIPRVGDIYNELLNGVIDTAAPTLQEMNERIPGYGVKIAVYNDGAELYQEIRDWSFPENTLLQSDDARLQSKEA